MDAPQNPDQQAGDCAWWAFHRELNDRLCLLGNRRSNPFLPHRTIKMRTQRSNVSLYMFITYVHPKWGA